MEDPRIKVIILKHKSVVSPSCLKSVSGFPPAYGEKSKAQSLWHRPAGFTWDLFCSPRGHLEMGSVLLSIAV